MDRLHGFRRSPLLSDVGAAVARDLGLESPLARCPVCDAADLKRFRRIRGFAYDRCTRCGLVFTNPYPSDAATHAFYNSDFYANYRILEARRREHDPYFSISMYTDPDTLAGWVNGDLDARVLDFGCGPGSFLALLRDRHQLGHVEGLEINRESVWVARQAYDLEIATSRDELRHDAYDYVLLLEVIEHVPHPAAFLADVAALVKPGGHLVITTPAIDGAEGRWFPQRCAHFTPPSHISLFSRVALQTLLARRGFHITEERRDESIPLLWDLLVAACYDLDFLSPQTDDDYDDRYYRPNTLGRRLKLRPGRVADVNQSKVFRLASLVDAALRRIPMLTAVVPSATHYYLLAQKNAL